MPAKSQMARKKPDPSQGFTLDQNLVFAIGNEESEQ